MITLMKCETARCANEAVIRWRRIALCGNCHANAIGAMTTVDRKVTTNIDCSRHRSFETRREAKKYAVPTWDKPLRGTVFQCPKCAKFLVATRRLSGYEQREWRRVRDSLNELATRLAKPSGQEDVAQ